MFFRTSIRKPAICGESNRPNEFTENGRIGCKSIIRRRISPSLARLFVTSRESLPQRNGCENGFGGKSGTNGWSYDTMFVVTNLVIVTTGGGNRSLMNWLRAL